MLLAPKVSESDIALAEQILLPPGREFDDERRAFIRRWDSLDLHAVPGSGKTTALQAKLLLLDRDMPKSDASGVLVLSHTNSAVAEIRRKLGPHCTRLFSYPNYVGTIQGFVDRFLAIPFYASKNGKQPIRIDDALYAEHMRRFMTHTPPQGTPDQTRMARSLLSHNLSLCMEYRFHLKDGEVVLASSVEGNELNISKPKRKNQKAPYVDWTMAEKAQVRTWLTNFKTQVMSWGVLCYDDAYFLAQRYLIKRPAIGELLRSRFRFVFVDEMQDMARHQDDLLNRIFGHENSGVCYQRIGDRNQAIYVPHSQRDECLWTPREPSLSFKKSARLSPQLARVLEPFALYRGDGFSIEGCAETDLPPTILVYSDNTTTEVIPAFSALVKESLDAGVLPPLEDCTFKVIGWNTTWSAENEIQRQGKRRLVDYWPRYERYKSGKEYDYPSLSSLAKGLIGPVGPSHQILDTLMSGALKALRLADAVDPRTNQPFNKTGLMSFLRETNQQHHEQWRTTLYECCEISFSGDINDVLSKVRSAVVEILELLSAEVSKAHDFIFGEEEVAPKAVATNEMGTNIANFHGFDIEVASVHSAKGQTHTATLYAETAFYSDGSTKARPKSYESQRLAPCFLGQPHAGTLGARVKQSTLTAYVGFSRPTHLLCVAIHEANFQDYLSTAEEFGWRVVHIESAQPVAVQPPFSK